jgi:Protein of unknown function (DUF3352)
MKHTISTNRRLFCASILLCSCFFAILLPSASGSAQTLPRTAKLVPPETVLLVNIENFNQLRTQFEKTNLYKLYKDPAMKPFVDSIEAKWEQLKQSSQNEWAKIIAEAGVLPEGRAALALVLDEQSKDANEPPLLFITQWGANVGKVKEAVGKIVDKAVENGARRQTEEYRGVTTTRLTLEPSKALSFCFVDDLLIGAMSPDALKFVIAQVKGAGSPTLDDDDDYNTTLRAVGPPAEGQIAFYVNIKQIIKTALAEDTNGKIKGLIEALGFANVTSFGGTVDVGAGPGGTTFGKALLKINGDKKGVCKMLDLDSAALRMPQFISASTSSVSVFNLNIKKAYTELGTILGNFSPQMAAMLNMPLLPPGPQGEPPLQLKADVVDHLGSQIIVAQSIKKDSSGAAAAPLAAPQTLVAIAIDDRAALEKSLSTLHAKLIAPGNPDSVRQLLGHTIYTINLPGNLPFLGAGQKTPLQAGASQHMSRASCPRFEGGTPSTRQGHDALATPRSAAQVPGPTGPVVAFTVTDTHLIIASESAVEQAVRALASSGTESIESAKWFAKAKSNIPSVVGLAGLEDNAASGEYFWSAMRQLQKKGDGASAPGESGVGSGSILPQIMLSQAGANGLDLSLLPEFDAVRKYFGVSASYGISRPDGFFFEFKYLNPDGD